MQDPRNLALVWVRELMQAMLNAQICAEALGVDYQRVRGRYATPCAISID